MVRMFSAGDKVFAKVRGYPAWPARVEAVADATPNKTKYHVFFYGTLETAVCKAEDLYPYAEYKENYGRPSKRKFFNEGLAQIEGLTPVPEPVRGTTSRSGDNDSDTEGNLIIDENPSAKYGKPVKRKRDSDSTGEDGEEKSLQPSSVGSNKRRRSSTSSQKRTKKDTLIAGTVSLEVKAVDSPATQKPEIVSRSGRKIKPKRFADDVSFDHSTNSTDIGSPDSKSAEPDEGKLQQFELNKDGASVWDTEVKYPNELSSKGNEIPTKENLKNLSQQYIVNIKTNNTAVSEKKIKNNYKYETLMKQVKERRKKKLAWLKIELRLMELEKLIRNKLRIDKAEPEKCLELFDELHHLSLQPLMLKKHPEVVETINKIKKYTGSITGQRFSQKQKMENIAVCEKIRYKAKLLIDKFARLLEIPDGCDFKDFFSKFVFELKEKTKNLTKVKFYSLTVDPTLVNETSNGVCNGKVSFKGSPKQIESRTEKLHSASDSDVDEEMEEEGEEEEEEEEEEEDGDGDGDDDDDDDEE